MGGGGSSALLMQAARAWARSSHQAAAAVNRGRRRGRTRCTHGFMALFGTCARQEPADAPAVLGVLLEGGAAQQGVQASLSASPPARHAAAPARVAEPCVGTPQLPRPLIESLDKAASGCQRRRDGCMLRRGAVGRCGREPERASRGLRLQAPVGAQMIVVAGGVNATPRMQAAGKAAPESVQLGAGASVVTCNERGETALMASLCTRALTRPPSWAW